MWYDKASVQSDVSNSLQIFFQFIGVLYFIPIYINTVTCPLCALSSRGPACLLDRHCICLVHRSLLNSSKILKYALLVLPTALWYYVSFINFCFAPPGSSTARAVARGLNAPLDSDANKTGEMWALIMQPIILQIHKMERRAAIPETFTFWTEIL